MVVFALALLLLGGVVEKAQAMEPAGHSFCKDGVGTTEQLAAKITRALAVDPNGNRKLEGCYATPLHFLIAFQEADPDAGLTSVSQLPGYVRGLVATEVDRTVEYQSSCIHDKPNGGTTVVMGCVTREVRHGEVIYSNPTTGKRVMWGGCANPGFAPSMDVVVQAERCIEVRFPSMGRAIPVRGAYIGPRALPGRCHALLLAGETERRHDMPEECRRTFQRMIEGRLVTIVCDWREVEENSTRYMRQPVRVQNVSYSFNTREEGTNRWFLPPEALEGLPTICWEMPDGTFRTLSVGRDSFVNGVATITEEQARSAIWR